MAKAEGPSTVCVINLKGGVGKSTIAALLSRYAFSALQKDVLAIDIDPQANLSQALMGKEYNNFLKEGRTSIVEIFNGFQPASGAKAGVAPLAANAGAETISRRGDNSLQLIASRFDFSDNLTNALRPDPKVLARYLAGNFQHKDLIVVDCAPTESILTHAAYYASGLVLVPVRPEFFATIGFPLLQQSLVDFRRKNRGTKIEVAGVVINNAFYDGGNDGGPEKARALKEITAEAKQNEWPVFNTQIPFSRGFPKIMRGDHSYSGNAAMFPRFAREFFGAVGLI